MGGSGTCLWSPKSRGSAVGPKPRAPRPDGSPPSFDAVVEDWFDDRRAPSAASASPEWAAVVADAPNLLDMARFQLLVVEEVPLPGRA